MYKYLSLTLISLLLFSCDAILDSGNNIVGNYSIIPKPVSLTPEDGAFTLDSTVTINVPGNGVELKNVGKYLQEYLSGRIGYTPKLTDKTSESGINLLIDSSVETGNGKYFLTVSNEMVEIKAGDALGIFYGVQTLRQLFPEEMERAEIMEDVEWSAPACDIVDYPKFPYRGMHLDVGRHFFPVSFIKKYIDLIAMHKMNKFHWHLTEDQGWRIEIKKYPKLTGVGAWRDQTVIGKNSGEYDGQRYGGFYTQEEVKEIVKYAQNQFVTIIPEIELPGHARAALAAYPELGCGDGPYTVATTWGVFEDVFCPKEETFTFLENVLTEVMDLFPSEYIHIGGDECPKTQWEQSELCQKIIRREGLKDEHELQSYFITRIEKFVNSKGRNIIGWDEILEGGLAPNATVMSWRGIQGGIEAANAGHNVIMTPTSHCYFDYYQSLSEDEPLAIGGFLPLKKVYSYDPIPAELPEDKHQHILGAQGNVWTEYMKTSDHVEYMAYPRATALAEVVWSPSENRNFDEFTSRLTDHLKRLEYLDVNFANHLFDVTSTATVKLNGNLEVSLSSRNPDVNIYYTLNGSEPTVEAQKYESPFELDSEAIIRTRAFLDGEPLGRTTSHNLVAHKGTGKVMKLLAPPHQNYSEGGAEALTNGKPGSSSRFNDGEWLAWNGENFSGIMNFDIPIEVSKIKMRFFNSEGSWVYLPSEVRVYASEDGEIFELSGSVKDINSDGTIGNVVFDVELKNVKALKLEADNYGTIPAGRQGEGAGAWLFVDEVIIQ